MNATLRSTSAAALAIGSRASTQSFVVAVTLVATRYLTPADFGIFALATVSITFARTLLYTGPFEYLMKAPDVSHAASESLAATILTALVTGLIVLSLALGSMLLGAPVTIGWLMLILLPTNLMAALASWQEALLLRDGRTRAYYIATIAIELVSALAAIALLIAGKGLGALVAQVYLRMALAVIGYMAMLRRPTMLPPRLAGVRRILHWSAARYGATSIGFLSSYSGDLILGALVSPMATGVFRASNRIVTAASDMFSQPAALLSRTALSQRFARQAAADGGWFAMFVGIAFIGWPALIGVALLADRIAVIALGPDWAAAGLPIAILALARLWAMLTAVASALLVTWDRQRFVFRTQLVTALAMVIATIALSPWNVVGVALATLIVSMTSSLWLARAAWRIGAVPDAPALLAAIATPVALTATATLAGRWLMFDQSGAGPLAFAIGCGAIGWLAGVLLVRRTILLALHQLTHRAG